MCRCVGFKTQLQWLHFSTSCPASFFVILVMAPPTCPLCSTECTRLETKDLIQKWACEENLKWRWHTGAQAYWVLCQPCHNAVWPLDHRVANRHSQPWSTYAVTLARNSSRCLVAGDFYLTTEPPELVKTSVLRALPNLQVKRRPLDMVSTAAPLAQDPIWAPLGYYSTAAPVSAFAGCLRSSTSPVQHPVQHQSNISPTSVQHPVQHPVQHHRNMYFHLFSYTVGPSR